MGKAVEITDSNFNDIVSKNSVVLVDFWAEEAKEEAPAAR